MKKQNKKDKEAQAKYEMIIGKHNLICKDINELQNIIYEEFSVNDLDMIADGINLKWDDELGDYIDDGEIRNELIDHYEWLAECAAGYNADFRRADQ